MIDLVAFHKHFNALINEQCCDDQDVRNPFSHL